MSFEGVQQESSPKHISEESADYREYREGAIENSEKEDVCFGEYEINTINSLRENINHYTHLMSEPSNFDKIPELTEAIKNRESRINTILINLKDKLIEKKKTNTNAYLNFLEEVIKSSEIISLFRERINQLQIKSEEYKDLLGISKLIEQDQVSNEELEKMCLFHIQIHERKRDEFNEKLPNMLADFRDAVVNAIRTGYLPITLDRLESRLGETRVFMGDPMLLPANNSMGDYFVENGTLRIAGDLNEVDQKKTLFHEMVHVLAGRTIMDRNKSDNLTEDIIHLRGGFSSKVFDTEGKLVSRDFVWIDEAVTEEITMYLAQLKEGDYTKERAALEELYKKGISQDSVYRTYFENYDPNTEQKVPEWKKLMDKIGSISEKGGGEEELKYREDVILDTEITELIEKMKKK